MALKKLWRRHRTQTGAEPTVAAAGDDDDDDDDDGDGV